MVTINDKISLITDVNNLFGFNDSKVQDMINGDVFIIDELYKRNLTIFKRNINIRFEHSLTRESMILKEWIKYYRCDINDPKSVIIFLRLAEPILI